MTFFEKNIQVIKENNFVLYEQLQLQQERLIDRVMSKPSRDGSSYLKVHIDGQWIALNSTYRPMSEAKKYSSQYAALPAYARMLVFGFGNGCMARALLAANPVSGSMAYMETSAHVKYAFYEPDAAVFLYVMQTCDLTDILANEDVDIFVEGMNEGQLAAWCSDQVDRMNEGSFYLASLPKYREYYGDAFERINHVYEDSKLRIHCDMNTKKALARSIMENNLYNLKYFVDSMRLEDFREMYPKEMPMLIVSAGPSLKQSVEQIKKLQGTVFIMAVDAAAWFLMKQGIRPDGIIAIDPKKDLFLFHKEMRDIPFFVHGDVNHLVLDKVEPKHVCFIATNALYYERLAQLRGDVLSSLDTGGSVATMALSLAIYLEINTVILIGQDLSVTAEASHVNGQKRTEGQTITVQGNDAPSVHTYTDFYLYLEWFQNTIAANPQMKVINATMGGAKIEGALYLHGDALTQEFDVEKAGSLYLEFAWQFAIYKLSDDICQPVERLYHKIESELEALKPMLEKGEQLAAKAIELVHENQMHTDAFKCINQELREISDKLVATLEFEWLESYSRDQEDTLFHNLYEKKKSEDEELLASFDKLRIYYRMLYDNVEPVLSLCRQAEK